METVKIKSINKKINLLDLLFLLTVILSITGYLFAKAEKTPISKVIQGKENIAIEVLVTDVHLEGDNIFKIGEKSAITIRNRPHTKLTIAKLEEKSKQLVIQDRLGTYKTINDPTRTDVKDYVVTLSDTAIKTEDGYVVGTSKVKIGNQVELEGFNYRVNGKIVGIYPLKGENK